MKPIKFRAWDKKDKRMRKIAQIDFECFTKEKYRLLGDGWRYKNKDKTELMQYTGLKDKNGVEIYEGDIINAAHFDGLSQNPVTTDFKIKVEWNKKGAGFNVPYTRIEDWYFEYEVIGNIYENPELLK